MIHLLRSKPMKTSKFISTFLAILAPLLSAIAQGGFQDLSFESARLVPSPGDPGRFTIAAAFPGWNGYYGTNQFSSVLYNNLTLGGASISILDSSSPVGLVIDGRYTAVLQAGLEDTYIAQIGLIPTSALLLEFKAFVGGSAAVSFAGQDILFSAIGSGPNYTLYGGDISAFAGQLGELRFTVQGRANMPPSNLYLDSIAFSSVPEPSTWAIAAVGCVLLSFRVWRKRCRR